MYSRILVANVHCTCQRMFIALVKECIVIVIAFSLQMCFAFIYVYIQNHLGYYLLCGSMRACGCKMIFDRLQCICVKSNTTSFAIHHACTCISVLNILCSCILLSNSLQCFHKATQITLDDLPRGYD